MLLAVSTLLVGAGGFSWGFYLGHGSREQWRAERSALLAAAQTDRADRAQTALTPGSCALSVDPQLLRAELAKALQGMPAVSAAAPTSSALATPTPAPSPLQIAAFDRARTAVDGAVARGSMTPAEVQDLRALMAQLDPDSRQDLTLRLVRAVNQDQLKFEDHQLPF